MKKRNWIVLTGRADSGKTSIIKKVYHKIQRKFPKCIVDHLEGKSDIDKRGDFESVIRIDSAIIGFFSQGDVKASAENAIAYFNKHKCNICITACRTKAATKNLITKEIYDNKDEHLWIHRAKIWHDEEYSNSIIEYNSEVILQELIRLIKNPKK